MLDVFKSDWFNRNNKNFTTKNTDYSIGWDIALNEQYSKFLYNAHTVSQLLSDKTQLRNELTSLLNAIGINKTISFVSGENTARTNGKIIQLSTKFSGPIKNDYDRLDVIIGLLFHEACHCKYTDFNHMRRVCEKYPKIVHTIHNIIEDELIERQLGLIKPGYVNFLTKVKYYFFNEFAHDISGQMTNSLDEIMQILLAVIRYPDLISRIDNDVLKKYEKLFIRIRRILTNNHTFDDKQENCTKVSMKNAIAIYKLIKKYIEKENKEKQNNGQQNTESNTPSDDSGVGGNGNDSNENNDDEQNENGDGQSDGNVDENQQNGNDVGKSNNSDENADDDNENDGKSNSIIDEDIDDMLADDDSNTELDTSESVVLSKLDLIYDNVSSTSEQPDTSTMYRFDDDILQTTKKEDIETVLGAPNNKLSHYTLTSENKHVYNVYLSQVKSFISDFEKMIFPNRMLTKFNTMRFQRNGTLDPTRLADAMQNQQTVYKRIIAEDVKINPKYALVLMIDESGSMDGGNCSVNASKLSILIYEAMLKYPEIELYVYGHGDVVNTYIDKHHKNKYVLGARRSQGGQNEEIAYQTIIDDVRSQTKLPIIAINITDSLYLSDSDGILNVINKYKNNRVFISLFALSHEYLQDSMIETNNKIYGVDNWAYWENKTRNSSIAELADKMAKIILKRVKF